MAVHIFIGLFAFVTIGKVRETVGEGKMRGRFGKWPRPDSVLESPWCLSATATLLGLLVMRFHVSVIFMLFRLRCL